MAFIFLSRWLHIACNFLRRWFRRDERSFHWPSHFHKLLNRWVWRSYWHKKLGRHLYGQFAMAAAPANPYNDDRVQLVSGSLTDGFNGPRGVFVGIYDGHGLEDGTCSQFVLDILFKNFKSVMQNHDAVNLEVIQAAYLRNESAFVNYLRENGQRQPGFAIEGSCCLAGVVSNNVLHVVNAGDSRAVLARWPDGGEINGLEVIQLSVDYNANYPAEHPFSTSLFTESAPGQWSIKGSLQVVRAIGHVYLMYNDFIQAEPYQLGPDDRFVIFASKGLWDVVDNDTAVLAVQHFGRNGAAEGLMRWALEEAANRFEEHNPGVDLRRRYHEDISIVILFFDNL